MRPFRSACLIVVLCWLAAPAPSVIAATTVSPLAPSTSNFELFGGRVDDPDLGFNQGTVDVTADCHPDATSTIHFHATGVDEHYGPYRGPYEYEADITLGPHTFDANGLPQT